MASPGNQHCANGIGTLLFPIADTDCPQLRSASERICVVSHTHNSFGDRNFSVASPCVWNALPSYLRPEKNYRRFKKLLKGHCVYAVTDHGEL